MIHLNNYYILQVTSSFMEWILNRSLQQMGGSIYVSLPVAWIRKHKLKAGDVVDIFIEKGRIIISSSNGGQE